MTADPTTPPEPIEMEDLGPGELVTEDQAKEILRDAEVDVDAAFVRTLARIAEFDASQETTQRGGESGTKDAPPDAEAPQPTEQSVAGAGASEPVQFEGPSAEVPEHVCPKCGAGSPPDRRCMGCGLVCKERDCPKCGRPTCRIEVGTEVVRPFAPKPQAAPPEPCKRCRAPLGPTSRICNRCGEKNPIPDDGRRPCTKLVRRVVPPFPHAIHVACGRLGRRVTDETYICAECSKHGAASAA